MVHRTSIDQRLGELKEYASRFLSRYTEALPAMKILQDGDSEDKQNGLLVYGRYLGKYIRQTTARSFAKDEYADTRASLHHIYNITQSIFKIRYTM